MQRIATYTKNHQKTLYPPFLLSNEIVEQTEREYIQKGLINENEVIDKTSILQLRVFNRMLNEDINIESEKKLSHSVNKNYYRLYTGIDMNYALGYLTNECKIQYSNNERYSIKSDKTVNYYPLIKEGAASRAFAYLFNKLNEFFTKHLQNTTISSLTFNKISTSQVVLSNPDLLKSFVTQIVAFYATFLALHPLNDYNGRLITLIINNYLKNFLYFDICIDHQPKIAILSELQEKYTSEIFNIVQEKNEKRAVLTEFDIVDITEKL